MPFEANGDNFSAFDDNGDFVNEHATPGLNKARAEAYNAAVGKPAGYLAITPYVPPQVRIAAGVLAAPTIAMIRRRCITPMHQQKTKERHQKEF